MTISDKSYDSLRITGISFWHPNRTILMLSCRWWRLVLLLHQCNHQRSLRSLNLRQLRFRLPDLIQLRLHKKCQNYGLSQTSQFWVDLGFEQTLTVNKLLPLLVTFFDDFISECLIFVFTIKSKIVFWFAIWNFVSSEPLSGVSQVTENNYLPFVRFSG